MAWQPSIRGKGRDGAQGGDYSKGVDRELLSVVTRCLAHTAHTCFYLCPRIPQTQGPQTEGPCKSPCDKPRAIPGSSLEVERALDTESKAWVQVLTLPCPHCDSRPDLSLWAYFLLCAMREVNQTTSRPPAPSSETESPKTEAALAGYPQAAPCPMFFPPLPLPPEPPAHL